RFLERPGPLWQLPQPAQAGRRARRPPVCALRPLRQLRRPLAPADASGHLRPLRPDDGGAVLAARRPRRLLPGLLQRDALAAGRAPPLLQALAIGRLAAGADGLVST